MLERLGAAFIAKPGLAVYSKDPNHFERIAGPVDGAVLISACAEIHGYRSDAYRWLLARARAEASDLDITELPRAGLEQEYVLRAHAHGSRKGRALSQ